MNGGGAVRPFRQPPRMDDAQAEDILNQLRIAIGQIHGQNAGSLSFEELYRNAYKLVLHKHGEKLYKGVEAEVAKHARAVGDAVSAATDDTLLRDLEQHWKLLTTTMTMIRDILMYMDRTFVLQERKEPVYDMGLRVFRECVIEHDKVRVRLRRILLEAVAAQRRGELVDESQLRSVLSMLVDLGAGKRGVYEEEFEKGLLAETKSHYEQEARELMAVSPVPVYLAAAQDRMAKERARAKQYMDPGTEQPLLLLVAEEMIGRHAEQLVQHPTSGLQAMLRDDKLADVARMYKLLGHKNCRDHMRACLAAYVLESGKRLVGDVGATAASASNSGKGKAAAEEEDDDASAAAKQQQQQQLKPADFVRGLLELQSKCETLLREALGDDKEFLKSVREAFEKFMNADRRCANHIATYLDEMLRSRLREEAATDAELGARLDAIVTLFKYLQDKDVFEEIYKRLLCKRLLSGRSVSTDAEASVIKKLRNECGQAFTVKLENMFKDMTLSRETMDRYRSARRQNIVDRAQPRKQQQQQQHKQQDEREDAPEPDLSVTVLTSGLWPLEQAMPCVLPPQLEAVTSRFKEFYVDSHSGRRLSWQANEGTADLKVRFPKATHELTVSTYQMLALMPFNAARALSFAALQEATGAPEAELKRHLLSLTAPRFRVLLREPARGSIDAGTVFTVNEAFSSRHYRVKVQLVSARPAADGGAGAAGAVPEQVAEDRKHLIEAAVVRIMKARKTLDMNQLVAEVTRQLAKRFHPTAQQIKQRVEGLMEREYLKRDDDDFKTFMYVA